jgi:hypothetical protein
MTAQRKGVITYSLFQSGTWLKNEKDLHGLDAMKNPALWKLSSICNTQRPPP